MEPTNLSTNLSTLSQELEFLILSMIWQPRQVHRDNPHLMEILKAIGCVSLISTYWSAAVRTQTIKYDIRDWLLQHSGFHQLLVQMDFHPNGVLELPTEHRTYDFWMRVVERDGLALKYIPDELRSPGLVQTAVEQDADALEHHEQEAHTTTHLDPALF